MSQHTCYLVKHVKVPGVAFLTPLHHCCGYCSCCEQAPVGCPTNVSQQLQELCAKKCGACRRIADLEQQLQLRDAALESATAQVKAAKSLIASLQQPPAGTAAGVHSLVGMQQRGVAIRHT